MLGEVVQHAAHFGGGVHACLGTSIARLAVKIAFEEFHKVVPSYRRRHEQLPWMPSSTFRSPLVLGLEQRCKTFALVQMIAGDLDHGALAG